MTSQACVAPPPPPMGSTSLVHYFALFTLEIEVFGNLGKYHMENTHLRFIKCYLRRLHYGVNRSSLGLFKYIKYFFSVLQKALA